MPHIDKIAWIHLRDRRVLTARSHGKDVFYLPGGKRESGESDEQCLIREIREELNLALLPGSLRRLAHFEAQAHGRPPGTLLRMTCYAAAHEGEPEASSEIAELDWLGYADKQRISPICQLAFDWLHARGELA